MPFVPVNCEEEYRKNKKLKKEDVETLLMWVKKQPHLPQVTESQAILFLQSCYFRMEAAKRTLDNYFTIRTLSPEIFGVPPKINQLHITMDIILCTILPKLTPEGFAVIWMEMLDPNSSIYDFNMNTTFFDMVLTLFLHTKGTCEGFIIVADTKVITLSHATKINLMTLKKFFFYLQEALPIRLKGIHFINVVPFVNKFMFLAKPFIKQELFEMLYLHVDSIESLYKFVPKEITPKNCGGSAPSIDELQDVSNRKIHENFDFFVQHQQQKVNEKFRTKQQNNVNAILGTDGSFRKLEVD